MHGRLPRGGFDHDRKAETRGRLGQRVIGRLGRVVAWDDGHAVCVRQAARLGLVAEPCDHLRRRAHPQETGAAHGVRERRGLREKPVPGVHRVRAGAPGRIEHASDVEVGLLSRGPRQRHVRVREPHVQRVAVRFRAYRHRHKAPSSRHARMMRTAISSVRDQDRVHAYMRNTPGCMPSIGALRAADSASPRTVRVSAGSMTPSSHSRAVL